MIHIINSIADQLLDYIKDDPVRPELPKEFRVDKNRFVAALIENDRPASMVCISLHNFIPECVEDLYRVTDEVTTVVLYTIWSYTPGGGRNLLQQILPELKKTYPSLTTFVTLSPKTEMARRFHLKNGAIVYRENSDTVNYQYSAA